ncbi:type 1 glutamine amidotransferase [Phaeovibrio sulfidiphilus]|uniref:Type 1 glutamine amidotransferase n=1 Tax=Phaeovibrio sulfidiphilus TaxID=1220600 RepID=A0A8J6YWT1_9PROT|nr:type 1 glutamine amidotransferase [Phaeovibrio sulfidiphilus]MBE1237904.1 type 1 glutamine amidotransferase [Phaeovibrio sulfidiphilus]
MSQPAVFLVIEGNTKAASRLMQRYGSEPFAEQYARVLGELWPGSRCEIVRPADGDSALPPGVQLADLDGAVLTGSFLGITTGGPGIESQIGLARSLLEAGVPFLGSCWGLQLVTAATGGTVRRAVKGRELGVARNLVRTAAGQGHPFLEGRPESWDALAVHQDEVERLPEGGTVLAFNAHSAVQAAEIRYGRGVFWGIQVHPEFDLDEMAATFERAAPDLIREGFFESEQDLHTLAARYRSLARNPDNRALAWALGLSPEILDAQRRRLEIRNWLDRLVRPARAARGR